MIYAHSPVSLLKIQEILFSKVFYHDINHDETIYIKLRVLITQYFGFKTNLLQDFFLAPEEGLLSVLFSVYFPILNSKDDISFRYELGLAHVKFDRLN